MQVRAVNTRKGQNQWSIGFSIFFFFEVFGVLILFVNLNSIHSFGYCPTLTKLSFKTNGSVCEFFCFLWLLFMLFWFFVLCLVLFRIAILVLCSSQLAFVSILSNFVLPGCQCSMSNDDLILGKKLRKKKDSE